MKAISTLTLLSIALTALPHAMTAPVDTDNTSPALTTSTLDKRQLFGVICVPGKAEGLTVTSAELDLEDADAAPAANGTANTLDADVVYPGQCDTGNQYCYLAWRNGSARCTGYCHCPTTNFCTGNNNYCYFKLKNGPCMCT